MVDDEPEVIQTMVRALNRSSKDISILTASNGAEAIANLEREPVDLIATDLNMPVLSGFHLLVSILKHCPGTPVMVLTAFDISTTQERINQRGFTSITYLQKPFSVKYFTATVREQLDQTCGAGGSLIAPANLWIGMGNQPAALVSAGPFPG